MDILGTISLIVGILGGGCAVIFGAATLLRARKKDDNEQTKRDSAVMTELGYIKSGIDDIKHKQEKQDEKQEKQHIEVISRLSSVEESTKQAHKRIDGIVQHNGYNADKMG